MQIETAAVNGFTMDYFRFGEGADTMVLLPGLSVQSVMGSADAVAQAYQLLAAEMTIYVFDRRADLPEKYSIKDMAEDTAAVIKALGLESVYLFGVSQGGMAAMQIAADHPELVRMLILGSTAADTSGPAAQTVGEWIRLAGEKKPRELYLAFGEAVYPEAVFEQFKDLLSSAAETVTDEELERFIVLAGSMDGFDMTDELSKITCPVLLLGSSDDRVLGPDAVSRTAQNLSESPCVELHMYEGFGHAAYDTAPDYRARVLDFIRAQKLKGR